MIEEKDKIIGGQIQESKKDLELLTKVLYEILPILKAQLKLDDYSSKDFNSIQASQGSQKREYLQSLLNKIIESKKENCLSVTGHNTQTLYKSKGLSTVSTEDEQVLKTKLERSYKYIENLKQHEQNFNDRILKLERIEKSLKQKLHETQNK